MRWLITVSAGADLKQLADSLAEHGVAVDSSRKPIPFEGGELVLTAQGPRSFPESARQIRGIVRVNPASKLKPFSSRAS